ncbi:MAG: DNA-protecting protein DprA [Betaproteobacteria bacterium HGW-Betaproteobacteria-11]|nr:MAG: DNA-protecting protein DprA [Betaproteobacteria bacterium HGW-Betaproteobacteria-11]
MTANLAFWLRLTQIPGLGGAAQRALLKAFGLPQAIFAASRAALAAVVGERLAAALCATPVDEAVLETTLAWAAQPGHHLLTLADAAYPQALLGLPDPPLLLYVQGRAALLAQPMLAVVGSRNATAQGVRDAQAFAEALGAAGLTVVSGLALGIDAAAHRGGLATPAGTVAVIGTGADRIYPARNQALAHEIAERGAIVSEFALGTPALAANFPRRNRLIAGFALGTLVVEAAPRSGSLITARLAAEAGREVFAIPGSIHSPLARGCHQLIREGAKLVESAQDILEELRLNPPPIKKIGADETPDPSGSCPIQQDETEEQVLTSLGRAPCTVDALAARSGLTAEQLLAILLPLELGGRIAQLPGGLYQRLD